MFIDRLKMDAYDCIVAVPKIETWLLEGQSSGLLAWKRALTFGSGQSYLNPNGLKYHLDKGTCQLASSDA